MKKAALVPQPFSFWAIGAQLVSPRLLYCCSQLQCHPNLADACVYLSRVSTLMATLDSTGAACLTSLGNA